MPTPKQKPGRSKQDYGTPKQFLDAVRIKLGIKDFSIDLAADEKNCVVGAYFDEEGNSLAQSWHEIEGWLWLNPPFANIRPWVQKAYDEAAQGAKIAVLVPASVGANWWSDWVHEKAHVLFIQGRLTFVGESTPYPKDTALLLYNKTYIGGYQSWDWKK